MDAIAEEVRQRLSIVRRQTAQASPLHFAQAYLPAHFRLPPSPMHRKLFTLLEEASRATNADILHFL